MTDEDLEGGAGRAGPGGDGRAEGDAEGAGDGVPAPEQQIDKIREIIFGGQMRDYELRFAELEREVTERTQRLADDLSARLEQMEQLMRDELERLGARLEGETRTLGERIAGDRQALDARLDADRQRLEGRLDDDRQQLRQRLDADRADFEARLQAEAEQRARDREQDVARLAETDRLLREQIDGAARAGAEEAEDIRSVLQQNSADFHDALLVLGERLDRALERTAAELADVKVSRSDLASLLGDVADRLRTEGGRG